MQLCSYYIIKGNDLVFYLQGPHIFRIIVRGMIYLNDHTEELNIGQALERVSQQRRELALRYVKDSDRRLSLAVYLLLQEALENEYGVTGDLTFGFGPHGKPFLQDYPQIHFNLSHCPGVALCVVSDAPVGCDVEGVPSVLDLDVCRRVFSEEEQTFILASPSPTLSFARLWTQKEAFLKYTGEGLTDHFPIVRAIRSETIVAPSGAYVYTICRHP